MTTLNKLLIDVRTPAEFETGYLSSEAINIEYQLIEHLPHILSTRGIDVKKSDAITLYCRSGRRSNIALQTLKELGYSNVRDIGGYEEANALLKQEEAMDRLTRLTDNGTDVPVKEDSDGKKQARIKALDSLLNGLKELE